MAGPFSVVIAGSVTAWLAFHNADGLVVDDYYKQGLAINQTLGRSETAARLDAKAELRFGDSRVSVKLGNAAVRGKIMLRLVHPTRAGRDQSLELIAVGAGAYEGPLQTVPPGRWHIVLEDSDWRLAGDWILPSAGVLTLSGRSPVAVEPGMRKEAKQ
jgi:hypothetical protein